MSHLSVKSSPVWYDQVRVSVLSHTGDYFPMTSRGIVSCAVLSLLYSRPGYVLQQWGWQSNGSVSLRGICLKSVQEVLLPYAMTFPEFIRLEFSGTHAVHGLAST